MYCIKLIDEAGEREIIPNVGTEKYHTYNSVRRLHRELFSNIPF